MPATSPLELLADELGAVAGRIERESMLRIEAIVSDLRRIDAERELRFVQLERRIDAALAPPAIDIVPTIEAAFTAAVAALPTPRDGNDADPEMIRTMVAEAVAALPKPKDGEPGRDADPEMIRTMVAEAVAALPKPKDGEPGPPGVLPSIREWRDEVHYRGDVVTRDGATYQAKCDTGHAPPHDDWHCIARAGRDGRSFRVCGTYSDGVAYLALDVVALNGASFAARRDDPGPCPGDGWQMIAAQGKRGHPGEPGRKGDPGPRGPSGHSLKSAGMSDDGLLTLTSSDGSTIDCDLYPLLSKLAR